jgi:predicted phosphoribosyltransferase
VSSIRKIVDDVICLTTPAFFYAVGQSYRNFSQTTDEEVRRLLEDTRQQRASPQEPSLS